MNITTVYAGDWQGIYINDELMYEGHVIEYDRLMSVLESEGMLQDNAKWQDEPVSDLVFRRNDNRLPRNLSDALKYNEGKHVEIVGDVVELYEDGKLTKRMPKSEYDLIVAFAAGGGT